MAKEGKGAADSNREREARDRAAHGQSMARGDTGAGESGVGDGRQGISNRPGDDASDADRAGGDIDHPAQRGDDALSPPLTEAGAPPAQELQRSSLDSPSQSGRSRNDRVDERLERSGPQETPRSDPEALRPVGSPGPDDRTM
jgi:hypothetical protein